MSWWNAKAQHPNSGNTSFHSSSTLIMFHLDRAWTLPLICILPVILIAHYRVSKHTHPPPAWDYIWPSSSPLSSSYRQLRHPQTTSTRSTRASCTSSSPSSRQPPTRGSRRGPREGRRTARRAPGWGYCKVLSRYRILVIVIHIIRKLIVP